MTEKIRLAILGATGMAGREALLHQQYLSSINNQYAEITCVTASQRSAGKKLGEVFNIKENNLKENYSFWNSSNCPEDLKDLTIDETDPGIIADKADYAISALGSDIAKEIEPELIKRGVHIFSNSSFYRWDPKVPLLIPEVNYQNIKMVEDQEANGSIVCNPNCTTAGYVPIINALEKLGHPINDIDLTTFQALSGKGDDINNPKYVKNAIGDVRDDWTKDGENKEEWKSSCEPQKILGKVKTREEIDEEIESLKKEGTSKKTLPIYTQTARVPTPNGHLEKLTINFKEEVSVNKLKDELKSFSLPEEVVSLPTTPEKLFIVLDRMPNLKDDLYKEKGMAVVVGDIKQHTPKKISLWTLTHNLRRGATWAGRQGLELYLKIYNNFTFNN